MMLLHEEKLYPPKVTVAVYSNGSVPRKAAVTLPVRGMKDQSLHTLKIVETYCAGKSLVRKGV